MPALQADTMRVVNPFLLGLRGAQFSNSFNAVSRHTIDIIEPDYRNYRCGIAVCDPQADTFSVFRATTVPGEYYVNNPLQPAGAAVLCPGLYNYVIGLHRRKYAALRQSGAFTLLRDTNRNKLMEFEKDRLCRTAQSGINIHYGYGPEIGRFSAGCQVIMIDRNGLAEWNAFFDQCKYQRCWQYLLINAKWLCLVEAFKSGHYPGMWLVGSAGDDVREIQRKLCGHGWQIATDGQYGFKTMTAVVAFQLKNGLSVDGVVGAMTLKEL